MSPLPLVEDAEQSKQMLLQHNHKCALCRVNATSKASVWHAEMLLAQAEIKATQACLKYAEKKYMTALKDVSSLSSSDEGQPCIKRAKTARTKTKVKARGMGKGKAKACAYDLEDVQSTVA